MIMTRMRGIRIVLARMMTMTVMRSATEYTPEATAATNAQEKLNEQNQIGLQQAGGQPVCGVLISGDSHGDRNSIPPAHDNNGRRQNSLFSTSGQMNRNR
jgi:hypothetical protein